MMHLCGGQNFISHSWDSSAINITKAIMHIVPKCTKTSGVYNYSNLNIEVQAHTQLTSYSCIIFTIPHAAEFDLMTQIILSLE